MAVERIMLLHDLFFDEGRNWKISSTAINEELIHFHRLLVKYKVNDAEYFSGEIIIPLKSLLLIFFLKKKILRKPIRQSDLEDDYRHAQEFLSQLRSRNGRPDYRRNLHILKSIETCIYVMLFQDSSQPDSRTLVINSLKIFFERIEDPVVTVLEVERFLLPLLSGEDGNRVLKLLCSCLIELFPECNVVYEPRSLKHLSRCAVRKSIKSQRGGIQEYGAISDIVSKFDIPLSLKEYLLVAEKKSQRRTRSTR